MALDPGTRLGTFEVVGPLGAGGMGEVYQARDTRLGRDVAIKVLPEAFAQDPVRLARFEREARMLASLNHPGLAAIYGLEEAGPIRYIVMELVPGETLLDTLAMGPLSIEKSLDIGRQIAEALEAAHEKGIVHRDLKPSNIKVTPDGKVKVLDLGLAKALDVKATPENISRSPTAVLDDTRPGVILGTAEFMSPEQARGKPLDKRTDIWSFGCILFEMLSGRRAFTGETISDVLAAILSAEPDWAAFPPATPPRIRELLSRCLQKDPNRRLRDIGEARIQIEETLGGGKQPPTAAPRLLWRNRAHLALGGALIAVAIASAWLALRPSIGRHPIPHRKYLAVRFRDLSGKPQGQLYCDGLAETVSVRLGRSPSVQVTPPSGDTPPSRAETDLRKIAESSGANLILWGTLLPVGDRIRVTYSLVNVETGARIAGDTVDGVASDFFAIQDQLAERVLAALELQGQGQASTPPALKAGLESPAARKSYLEALGHLQRYDKEASVEAAITLLKPLTGREPESALVHAALGRAYLYKYNLTRERPWADKAMASSARAEQLNPKLPEVDLTLGELRRRTGQPKDAITAFQRALARQPQSYDAVRGLADAEKEAGQFAAAEASYRRAIALRPEFWSAYNSFGSFLATRGRFGEAAEQFQRVVRLQPDSVRGYNNLGACLSLVDRLDEARRAYEKSIALEPNAQAYTNLGSLLYLDGRFADAARAFERATQLEPGKFLHWANLGDAYRWEAGRRGDAGAAYAKAIALAQDELALKPTNAPALRVLARSFAKTGDLPHAREAINRALALEPDNPNALVQAAVVANLDGKPDEAVARIAAALKAGLGPLQVEREPEFRNLTTLPAFREALSRARARTPEQASPSKKEGS